MPQRIHRKRRTCRLCASDRLRLFLSLGPMPPANAFLSSPAAFANERSFPLDVYFCEACSLVQLLDMIDPEFLFRDYIYVTGTSETMAAHNAQYASEIIDLLRLGLDDLVVEIASNDGSLLSCFKQHGVATLGIEPATNVAQLARARGIETLDEFFNAALAQEVRDARGQAKAVIGNNVLAHVDDPVHFLRGCRQLVADGGLVVLEVPYLGDLLDRLEYDTIYHEHLSYFSVRTLTSVCELAGLDVIRVDPVAVHGGSLRVYAAAANSHNGRASKVQAWLDAEQTAGLGDPRRYERFAEVVARNRQQLTDLLQGLSRRGKTLAAYGAPAKGNTLLNACCMDDRLIPYAVDLSPMKVGLYTPGAHLPVLPVSTLLERRPDYVLLLAWNLADEIMRQQQEYVDGGGRFILPIPEPRIV